MRTLVDVVTDDVGTDAMCNVGSPAYVASCHMREFISGVDYL